jgi:hypothetical protein
MTKEELDTLETMTKAAVDSALEPAKEALSNIVSPFTKELGQIIALPFKYQHLKMALIYMDKAKKPLNERGVTPQQVPMKLLSPILENGSIEEDESMIDRWATLLANAADPNTTPSILPSYAAILKELSPIEAKVLDMIYGGVIEHQVYRSQWRNIIVTVEQILKEAPMPRENFIVLIENLSRLRLIDMPVGDAVIMLGIQRTHLGFGFVSACRPKGTQTNIPFTFTNLPGVLRPRA